MGELAAYLHCGLCLNDRPDGVSPRDYARLSVGVGAEGGLVVQCDRHNVEVANWPNDEIAEALKSVSEEACSNCGGSCQKEETQH